MIHIQNKASCSGCHACVNACPQNCISMQWDDEGFLYPVVDESVCLHCGVCQKVCPVITPVESDNTEKTAYAACTKDEEIRKNSSSGGVFSEIAAYVIQNGGVVFGAGFDENWNVSHICVNRVQDLSKLRGSKYVQSTIGDTYQRAKDYLKENKPVLFTGTPCQIAGLYSFLGKNYENLITADFICHGVPSPYVWKEYKKYRLDRAASEISNVSFRDKKLGWKVFSMRFDFSNDTQYSKPVTEDLYYKCFLSDLCLRPSCYECAFKKPNKHSDITLADFWGIQYIKPEINDNKGLSLVLIHSTKGASVFKNVRERLFFEPVDRNEAIKYNPSLLKAVNIPPKRNAFLKYMQKNGFEKTTKRFFGGHFLLKIKRLLKGKR